MAKCAFMDRECTEECMAHVNNLKDDGKILMNSRDNQVSDICFRLYTMGRFTSIDDKTEQNLE